MYSQNDYRDYLEHKWTWPKGKNSKEYNAWYYKNHKEKWKKSKIADALGFDDKQRKEDAEAKVESLNKELGRLKSLVNNFPSSNLTPQQKQAYNNLMTKYYKVLDQYNAAQEERVKAQSNYNKNGSLAKVIDDGPIKTAQRAVDAVSDKVLDVKWDIEDKVDEVTGSKARRQIKEAQDNYSHDKKMSDLSADNTTEHGKRWHEHDVERANKSKAVLDKALEDYGNTPIGRLQNTFDVLTGKKKVAYD